MGKSSISMAHSLCLCSITIAISNVYPTKSSCGSTNLADKTFTICCRETLRWGHARNHSLDLLRLGIHLKDTRPFQACEGADSDTAWKKASVFLPAFLQFSMLNMKHLEILNRYVKMDGSSDQRRSLGHN